MIEEWLASKNVDLWGDWRISDPERRKLAAAWFGRQMAEYMAYCASQSTGVDETEAIRQEYGSRYGWDVVV